MFKKKNYFILLLVISNRLLSCLILNDDQVKTMCLPMSDAYPMRYMYHKQYFENEFQDKDSWIVKPDFFYRYERSFNGNKIGALLFKSNPIVATYDSNISPYLSSVDAAIGMKNSNCNSSTYVNGVINNNFFTMSMTFMKIDYNWYFNFGIPVQRANYTLNLNETVNTNGLVTKGYFGVEYSKTDIPNVGYENIASTNYPALKSLTNYLSGSLTGNMVERIYATIKPNCGITTWGLADIYCQLGYDFCKFYNGQYGFYGRVIIPTSASLSNIWAKNIFSPIIGNIGRLELDFGFNGHYYLWDCDNQFLKVVLDAYIGYIGSSSGHRTFDLNNGPMTRYSSVKVFNYNNNYDEFLIWGADLTTQCLSVYAPLKSEIVLDCIYKFCNQTLNIGYSFKGQAAERTCFNGGINKDYYYGLASRCNVQTPYLLNNNLLWTNNMVTPLSSMYETNPLDITAVNTNGISNVNGILMSDEYAITSNDININSGLMNTQILNIMFLGYKYISQCISWNPEFGISASIGFSTIKYYTPELWDLNFSIKLDY